MNTAGLSSCMNALGAACSARICRRKMAGRAELGGERSVGGRERVRERRARGREKSERGE